MTRILWGSKISSYKNIQTLLRQLDHGAGKWAIVTQDVQLDNWVRDSHHYRTAELHLRGVLIPSKWRRLCVHHSPRAEPPPRSPGPGSPRPQHSSPCLNLCPTTPTLKAPSDPEEGRGSSCRPTPPQTGGGRAGACGGRQQKVQVRRGGWDRRAVCPGRHVLRSGGPARPTFYLRREREKKQQHDGTNLSWSSVWCCRNLLIINKNGLKRPLQQTMTHFQTSSFFTTTTPPNNVCYLLNTSDDPRILMWAYPPTYYFFVFIVFF